jgi:hypothetical protein
MTQISRTNPVAKQLNQNIGTQITQHDKLLSIKNQILFRHIYVDKKVSRDEKFGEKRFLCFVVPKGGGDGGGTNFW